MKSVFQKIKYYLIILVCRAAGHRVAAAQPATGGTVRINSTSHTRRLKFLVHAQMDNFYNDMHIFFREVYIHRNEFLDPTASTDTVRNHRLVGVQVQWVTTALIGILNDYSLSAHGHSEWVTVTVKVIDMSSGLLYLTSRSQLPP